MFKKNIVLFITSILAVISLISCSDDLTSIGADLLTEDLINIENIDSQNDSLSQSSSFFKRTVPLSSSNRLFLGKSGNVESSILVRYFFLLPEVITNDTTKYQRIINGDFTVSSADISFTREYNYGDENGTLEFTAHEITSKWSTQFTIDSLPSLQYNANDLKSNKELTDSLLTFSLDTQFAYDWFKAEADTNTPDKEGIILVPSPASTQVIGFTALNEVNTNYSILTVAFQVQGYEDKDTLRFFPTIDLSAVDGEDLSLSSDYIALQSSVVYNSKLWFDISSIPPTAIINKATLSIQLDTLQSKLGNNFNNAVTVFRYTDSASIALDSTRAINLQRDTAQFTGDVSPYVQSWVRNGNNQGLFLVPASQLSGLELFILKGSNHPNFAERPRLTITYTNKK